MKKQVFSAKFAAARANRIIREKYIFFAPLTLTFTILYLNEIVRYVTIIYIKLAINAKTVAYKKRLSVWRVLYIPLGKYCPPPLIYKYHIYQSKAASEVLTIPY